MSEYYTCGHEATFDDNDEYSNGSYALWPTWEYDLFTGGPIEGEAYGVLCNDCMPRYGARKCKLGGEEL